MSKPNVLIINTYAGSLILAAKAGGYPIIGSYEDEGYGLPIQRENFPQLNFRERLSQWPEQDLSETIVLAHPPCAAFSQQNNSASAKGTDAKKFQCTINVITYAFRNKAMALAIESVPKALEGARSVHDALAREHGYDVFRVLQNAASFGLPQWRPRFWIIFLRKGITDKMRFFHTQAFKTIEDIMEDGLGTDPDPHMSSDFMKQIELLDKSVGFEASSNIIMGNKGYGGLPAVLRQYFPDLNGGEIAKKYCVGGNFMSHCLRLLDPSKFATTLLFDSWWACKGRTLTKTEYKRIMGFPDDYKLTGKFAPKFREFLSRGVCPPIAGWILESINNNIKGIQMPEVQEGIVTKSTTLYVCDPGMTIDLNINKREFGVDE